MIVDPSLKEEAAMQGGITLIVNPNKEVCAVHKAGGVAISSSQLFRCVWTTGRVAVECGHCPAFFFLPRALTNALVKEAWLYPGDPLVTQSFAQCLGCEAWLYSMPGCIRNPRVRVIPAVLKAVTPNP